MSFAGWAYRPCKLLSLRALWGSLKNQLPGQTSLAFFVKTKTYRINLDLVLDFVYYFRKHR